MCRPLGASSAPPPLESPRDRWGHNEAWPATTRRSSTLLELTPWTTTGRSCRVHFAVRPTPGDSGRFISQQGQAVLGRRRPRSGWLCGTAEGALEAAWALGWLAAALVAHRHDLHPRTVHAFIRGTHCFFLFRKYRCKHKLSTYMLHAQTMNHFSHWASWHKFAYTLTAPLAEGQSEAGFLLIECVLPVISVHIFTRTSIHSLLLPKQNSAEKECPCHCLCPRPSCTAQVEEIDTHSQCALRCCLAPLGLP